MYPNLYPQKQQITRVNGRAGAEMYQLAPDSSILLLDETEPIVWVKISDGGGYCTVKPFALNEYKEPKPVDIQSLEDRIKRLEEAVNEQSNSNNAKSIGNGTIQATPEHGQSLTESTGYDLSASR